MIAGICQVGVKVPLLNVDGVIEAQATEVEDYGEEPML